MNQEAQNYFRKFAKRDQKMPVFFVGHGSPMNGILDTEFSRGWKDMVNGLDIPSAVLVVSAHWLTNGTLVTAMDFPKTIHDFGGFPQELYEVQYPAPGSPDLAHIIQEEVSGVQIHLDHEWGLDHGAWTVVRHMFPDAQIPVLQLSIDYFKPAEYHYKLAQELLELRQRGVLIIGSGNMIHNLRILDWNNIDRNVGYDWAEELNERFLKIIEQKEHSTLFSIQNFGEAGKLAVPTPDHYYPLLYALGLQDSKDEVEIFNNKLVGGSISMTSLKLY